MIMMMIAMEYFLGITLEEVKRDPLLIMLLMLNLPPPLVMPLT